MKKKLIFKEGYDKVKIRTKIKAWGKYIECDSKAIVALYSLQFQWMNLLNDRIKCSTIKLKITIEVIKLLNEKYFSTFTLKEIKETLKINAKYFTLLKSILTELHNKNLIKLSKHGYCSYRYSQDKDLSFRVSNEFYRILINLDSNKENLWHFIRNSVKLFLTKFPSSWFFDIEPDIHDYKRKRIPKKVILDTFNPGEILSVREIRNRLNIGNKNIYSNLKYISEQGHLNKYLASNGTTRVYYSLKTNGGI